MPDELPAIPVERRVIRKLYGIVSFLLVVMFTSVLDRSNVGFASLTMNPDIGLSAAQFGFGVGLLAVGDMLFAVPSNMAAQRWRPHRWAALLMIMWGFASAAMALIESPTGFYVVRFVLGAAEAGAMPCILLMLGLWIPPSYRAKTMAIVTAGAGLASVLGPLIGVAVFRLDGLLGLKDWQWLFLVEGLPVVLIGVLAVKLLPESPLTARWLTPDERAWLVEQLESAPESSQNVPRGRGAGSYRLALLAILNFTVAGCGSVLAYWLPLMAREIMNLSMTEVGVVSAPVYGAGVAGAIALGAFSDRVGGRFRFIAGGALFAATALAAMSATANALGAFVLLIIAIVSIRSCAGIYFAAMSESVRGKAKAHGFGVIVIFGSLGSFFGNWLFGTLREVTGEFAGGIGGLAGLMIVCAGAAYLASRDKRGEPAALAPAA